MILHRDGRSLASVAIVTACMLPCRVAGQAAPSRATGCDSVLRAARVDPVGVTARAYLVRRDGAEAPDLAALEEQIRKLTSSGDFQTWSQRMSGLLTQSPKREVYIVAG